MAIERYEDDKAAFFDELQKMRPDLVFEESWTSQQKQEAANLLKPNAVKMGMLKVIPLDCQGMDCLYAELVPLLHQGGPTHKKCPVEMATVVEFFESYVVELGVDTDRLVEATIVRDLVNQDIQALRASIILAREHFVQENVAGLDPEGNVIVKKELHQAIEYEDKILKRKERLRNQLLATRESRAKLGQTTADSAQAIAEVLQDVRRLERVRDQALKDKLGYDDDIEDAEIVDAEEY